MYLQFRGVLRPVLRHVQAASGPSVPLEYEPKINTRPGFEERTEKATPLPGKMPFSLNIESSGFSQSGLSSDIKIRGISPLLHNVTSAAASAFTATDRRMVIKGITLLR